MVSTRSGTVTDAAATTSTEYTTETTTETMSTEPTITQAPVESTPVAIEKSQPLNKSSKKSTKSQKAQRILVAKANLWKIRESHAAACLAAIEAEQSDDDDENSVTSIRESIVKVDEWLNKSQVLAISDRPHIPSPVESRHENDNEATYVTSPLRTTEQLPPQGMNVSNNVDFSDLVKAITIAVQAGQRQQTFKVMSDLPIFNGAYQEWLTFKTAYSESEVSFNNVENMSRLRKSLKGRAREAVERMLFNNTSSTDVMKQLELRFGRPDTIARNELERLRSLNKPSDNPRDLCIFACQIANIVATLRSLNKIYYLYNPEVTKITIEKLTPTLRYRWFEFSSAQKEDEADLLKLTRFLDKEAEMCGPYAQPEEIAINLSVNKRTQRSYNTIENTDRYSPTVKRNCFICNKSEHYAAMCYIFKKADNQTRWELAKKHRLCFRCLKYKSKDHRCTQKTCEIDGCRNSHHRMLHYRKRQVDKSEITTEAVASTWTMRNTQSYLKIVPVTVSGPAGEIKAQALLDDGSTVTLIDAELARRVGARGPLNPLRIEAIAETKLSINKSRCVSLALQGTAQKLKIRAHTIERLRLSPQAVTNRDLIDCEHLIDIQNYLQYDSIKPQILIGQDNWQLLLASEVRQGKRNQPVASLTPLGWVLHGARTRSLGQKVNYINHLSVENSMDEQLKHYFAIESLTITPQRPKTDPTQRALTILNECTSVREGRYETGLLWKRDDINLPNNYDNALSRLLSTEKKIDKNSELKLKYEQQMSDLIEKGYAEIAPRHHTPNRTWYLPHFAVVNPMKPDKIRIVHDAAAKTKGVSLNDHLLTGPDLLQSLPGVMMRFRQHPIAVSADIAEMFMQVKIRPEDRDALRYLWRGSQRVGIPQEYRMTSLIFGATCSPSAAIFVKNLNASKFEQLHPTAVSAIVNNHYVDDYLDSFRTADEAIKTASQVRDIHKEGRFHLRQWASNSEIVKRKLDIDIEQKSIVNLSDGTNTERVLGLIWKPGTDELAFNLDMARVPKKVMDCTAPTKREALRIVMSLFDPLGLVSPVTIRAKQILQELWRRGTDWDKPMDPDIADQWKTWMVHLRELRDVSIPRCYLNYSDAMTRQLHIFVDASEAACSAALYWRTTSSDGLVQTSLILAKSRVAPLKLTSIPRLELQAAVMGSRMANTVITEHQLKPESKTFWTDSQTVLTWLKTGSRSYRPFVAHRVAAIEENSSVNEWRWVPTKLNVADDATRDVPRDFNKNHRWFHGPEFLLDNPENWPKDKNITPIVNTGEEKVNYIKINEPQLSQCVPDCTRFSKWERLRRATARVLQFIELCRHRSDKTYYKRTKKTRDKDPDWKLRYKPDKKKPRSVEINIIDRFITVPANMLREAEILLIRVSQQESFSADIEDMKNDRNISNNSRLHSLSVTLINDVIRLNTRIGITQDVTYELKRPPVIDGDHRITQLIIENVHQRLHHAGAETTINECRQMYWILRLRTVTRTIISRCIPCRIRRSVPTRPATGNHPMCRLAHHRRPFTYTGVDYFGPLTVTIGRSTQKRYVALFTCLTTRAVHLEIAASLSTDSAIMALRRMMARRGCPTEIWSDNGSNLRGADKELRQAIDSATEHEANRRTISWKYIPPGAPFMGGAWERLVKSVKKSLSVVLNERHPHEEVLSTLIAEVEYIVNSRPLTHVSVDSHDLEALTPNHFLLNGHTRVPIPGTFDENDMIGRNHWRAAQCLADLFWKRWIREYLPDLQYRREPHSRGPAPEEGNVVLIVDTSLPRNVWPMGIVTATYPGADGIVRVVDVRTRGGILRRPTKRLVILPTEPAVPARSVINDLADDDRRE